MIIEEGNKVKIAVYGSLRLNEYNYKAFVNYYGEDNMKYIKTITSKGFDLIDLGSYPGIKMSKNSNAEVVFDIMECSSECYRDIENMELGAGYSRIIIRDEDNNSYIAFLYDYPGSDKIVESGDWSKYLREVKSIKYVINK